MSNKIEGSSCARCKAYLFSDDDIVYCPVCGAPHHRECYNVLGHCALESLHGTDAEYSKEKELQIKEKLKENESKNESKSKENEATCGMCGERFPKNSPRCPKCGMPNISQSGAFMVFDSLGGVPADYEFAENVTAEDTKKFILANTHRYIPKFVTLDKKNKASWNWLAFLFPSGWFLSRKMFKSGIIIGLFTIIFSLFSLPLRQSIINYGFSNSASYSEMFSFYSQIDVKILIFSVLGFFLDLALRLFAAILGDYFYKNYCVEAIKKIKTDSSDIDYDYRKKGGVNIFYFLIAYFVIQYVPVIIYSFI